MTSPIEQVPTDVFACITAYLFMSDLCALSRVTKAYHTVVQPLLWTVIEMHGSGFHVESAHNELRAEEATRRTIPPYNVDGRVRGRSEEFLKMISGDQTWGKELREGRKEELGALVRWLCLPTIIKAPSTLAQTFAHFVNLEHLEISMFWEPNPSMDVFQAPLPGLRKLTTLKLRGYFPKDFVRWLLMQPERVEELQLAVLDRPVGNSNCAEGKNQVNPPPLENQRPKDPKDMTEDELANADEHEDLTSCEWVAPRPLACLTPEIMSRLISLKRLYLCKPSNGTKIDDDVLHFSTFSDERIFQEWNTLLRATRNTLQHLTLDQRPVAQENVADGTRNKEYMRQCANSPSYTRFVEMVLPALLESNNCPNLEVIRLIGFEAHDEGVDEFYRNHVDHPNCSVDVPGQLRAAFPNAEVSDYAGRRLISWMDSGEVMPGK
jgi:hypothetical protein